MLTHVEFRSDRFPALEGEEDMINPDLWGRLLADFLRQGLIARGYEIPEPIAEDWGWCLRVLNQPFSVWIGCGHYQEYPDSYLCFIEPHKAHVWKFFRRISTITQVQALQIAMDEVLAEGADIRAKQWWTHEEFNSPSKYRNRPQQSSN
jgi:hypothetical protein